MFSELRILENGFLPESISGSRMMATFLVFATHFRLRLSAPTLFSYQPVSLISLSLSSSVLSALCMSPTSWTLTFWFLYYFSSSSTEQLNG